MLAVIDLGFMHQFIYLGLQSLPIPAMTEYQDENILLTLNEQKPNKKYKTML